MNTPDFGRLRWRLLAANLAVATAGIMAIVAGVAFAAPRAFDEAMGMRAGGGMMGGAGGRDDGPGPALRLRRCRRLRPPAGVCGGAGGRGHRGGRRRDLDRTPYRRSRRRERSRGPRATTRSRVPAAPGELGELAASFNGMAASLAANEQRRRDLIGDVAHELRTPITSVRGYVEGLEAGVFEPGPDAWRVLDEQTARLEHLVDDLALLWRAESHDLRLDLAMLDGPALLADVRERHRGLAGSRSVELVLGSIVPAQVLADPVRLAQVLDNLVGNALRYTSAGGRVELGLAPSRTDRCVLRP